MPDRRLRVARLLLWASLVGLIIHLIDGDKPWSGGIVERLAEGLPPREIDYARTYRWWISLGGAAVVIGLLATLRHWIGPPRAAECPDLAAPERGGRAVAGVAALAMLTAALMAGPRLDFSFWDDERSTVRHSLDGKYTRSGEGDLVFQEVRWRDSWLYTLNRPNNHVPFTLLARLSLGAWRALAQPELRLASDTRVVPVARRTAMGGGLRRDTDGDPPMAPALHLRSSRLFPASTLHSTALGRDGRRAPPGNLEALACLRIGGGAAALGLSGRGGDPGGGQRGAPLRALAAPSRRAA
jgi:hypothetical protein